MDYNYGKNRNEKLRNERQNHTAAGSNTGGIHQGGQAARNTIDESAERIKEQTRNFTEKATSYTENGKNSVAALLDDIGSAVGSVGNQLRDSHHETIADYVDKVAYGVHEFSDKLNERDPVELVRQSNTVARQHPEMVIGGMLLAGFVLGRFLNSAHTQNDNE